jgi:hypothetical protein
MRAPILTVAVLALAGCGGGAKAPSAATPTPTPRERAPVTVDPADRPACAQLYARLQRVTTAVAASSELIAHSLDKGQLSQRIAIEEVQLRRSARLMASGPTPASLDAATAQIVTALRQLARDFARAREPAAQGDFAAAAQAMTDPPVVDRIVRASKTIEDACR